MFKRPFDKPIAYTRPMLTGKLVYGNRNIINEISTLIVINSDGDILTTAHNADKITLAVKIKHVFSDIMEEIASQTRKRKIKQIEKKYGITSDTVIDLYNIIVDVYEKTPKFNIIKHDYLDLAVIKTEEENDSFVKEFPVLKKQKRLIGDDVYSIGFAFPEFVAFKEKNNKVVLDEKFIRHPFYPTKGLAERHIADSKRKITMFESSLKFANGMQGAPVFNDNSEVIGMIAGERNIDFIDENKRLNYMKTTYSISSNEIMEFLDKNKIKYNEGNNA